MKNIWDLDERHPKNDYSIYLYFFDIYINSDLLAFYLFLLVVGVDFRNCG